MTTQTETAILAGGCFWGMQDLLRRYPGVLSTRVGYSGGDVPNATYRNHGNHAEAIEIVFDPQQISYRQILEFFFQIHDPTTQNRQGNDIGASYRSALFYLSDEQKRVAEDTVADVEASGLWPGKVVTEITPAGPFWEAEPEHQDYGTTSRRLYLPLHPPQLDIAKTRLIKLRGGSNEPSLFRRFEADSRRSSTLSPAFLGNLITSTNANNPNTATPTKATRQSATCACSSWRG